MEVQSGQLPRAAARVTLAPSWLVVLDEVGSEVARGGFVAGLECLRAFVRAEAVILRDLEDDNDLLWSTYSTHASLASHRNALRAFDCVPDGVRADWPLEVEKLAVGATDRLRAWGVESLIIVDSPEPALRLELYLHESMRLDDSVRRALRTIIREIAHSVARHRSLQRSRRASSFLRRLTDDGPTIVHVYVPNRAQTIFSNGQCVSFFAPEELLPDPTSSTTANRHPWLRRVVREDAARLRRQLVRTERLADGSCLEGSYRFRGADGPVQLRLWTKRIPRHGRRADDEIVVTALDESRQRELEEHVARLEANEQGDLRREIHDGICQDLIGMQMSLSRAVRRAEQIDADTENRLVAMGEALDQCIQRARALSHGVRPLQLYAQDLAPALRDVVEGVAQRFEVECRFFARGTPAWMHPEEALQIYWIAREALMNAAKHAGARCIDVHLRGNDTKVELRVIDDGRGFAPERADGNGMGLRILDHRARMIGAELRLESAPGAGTTVVCALEVQENEEHEI